MNITNFNPDELAELNAIAKADMLKRQRTNKQVQLYIYIHISISIEREREREGGREGGRERECVGECK